MKRVAIFYSEYTPTIDAIKCRLSNSEIIENPKSLKNIDLFVKCHYSQDIDENALEIHHSLLPAFNSDTPLKDAFLSGVKVTGISVYFTKTQKIIAQYPIFINNSSHYDEIERELQYLEQTIYPLVIEKVLNNESFEIQSLLGKKSCSHSCGGCDKCKH